MELISREQIVSALKQANPLIREAFGSDATATVIMKLQERYNLHIDVIDAVSQELGNLLLGLIDPAAFFARIQERGVGAETAKSIVDDINRDIFLPLQKRIRDNVKVVEEEDDEDDDLYQPTPVSPLPAAPERATEAAPPQVPIMNIGTSDAAPTPAQPYVASQPPVPQEPPAYNLIRPEAPVAATIPTPAPVQPPVTNPAPAEAVYIPPARTMAGDVEAITHPELVRPQPEQGRTMPAVPHPWQTSPAQSFQTASVPYTSMPVESRAVPVPPPVNLPTEWSTPVSRPVEQSLPRPTIQPLPQASSMPDKPLTKEYGSDPYREPIA